MPGDKSFKKIGNKKWAILSPDPAQQHLKNPKMEKVKVPRKIKKEDGTEETVMVDKWRPKILRVDIDSEGRETAIHEMGGEPKWGLVCPGQCGRFWWFLPDPAKSNKWVPKDTQAWQPHNETRDMPKTVKVPKFNANNKLIHEEQIILVPTVVKVPGYLKWKDNMKFKCDKCNVEINLKRSTL